MAIEIKTTQCKPADEEETIRLYQDFGWTFKSSQQVYNKDSHLENQDGQTYSVTETISYVKLVFERDSKMPHYEDFQSMWNRYCELVDALPSKPKYPASMTIEEWTKKTSPDIRLSTAGAWWGALFWGAAVLGVVLAIVVTPAFLTLCEPAVIGGIIYAVVYHNVSRSKALKKALANTDPALRAKLESLYQPQHDLAVLYEESLLEMKNLRRQAAALVE